jgi:hypothetical protein
MVSGDLSDKLEKNLYRFGYCLMDRVPSRSIKTEYMDHWKLVLDGFLALLSFRINTLGLSLKNRSLLMRGRGLNGDISSSNMVLLF